MDDARMKQAEDWRAEMSEGEGQGLAGGSGRKQVVVCWRTSRQVSGPGVLEREMILHNQIGKI